MKVSAFVLTTFLSIFLATSSVAEPSEIGEDEIPNDIRLLLLQKNYANVAPMLLELSKNGNREAAYFLGHMHVCGKGVEFSCSNAAKMFKKSFENEEASIIDPIWAKSARGELAWIHAACEENGFKRDEKLALRLARAVTRYEADPYQLDTLAAAYASVNQYKKAIATQEKALSELIALAKTTEIEQKTINVFKQHLSSYRTFKPWRFAKQDAESECNALP